MTELTETVSFIPSQKEISEYRQTWKRDSQARLAHLLEKADGYSTSHVIAKAGAGLGFALMFCTLFLLANVDLKISLSIAIATTPLAWFIVGASSYHSGLAKKLEIRQIKDKFVDKEPDLLEIQTQTDKEQGIVDISVRNNITGHRIEKKSFSYREEEAGIEYMTSLKSLVDQANADFSDGAYQDLEKQIGVEGFASRLQSIAKS